MTEHIWYASYGSNLLRARFDTYIRGGTPEGAATGQVGCTDPSPPRADAPVRIPHRLKFAGRFGKWQGRGVAFIDRDRDATAGTLGRMYLVTAEQFVQIVLQENGHDDFGVDLDVDLGEAVRRGSSRFRGGAYSVLLRLGFRDGSPILTFTTDGDRMPANAPSPAYLTTMVRGIREAYTLTDDQIVAYLRSIRGLRGSAMETELVDLVAATPR
jgi:hypothetical protein